MKEHLGHYQIIAELGRGGMGVVYKGYETSLNRYVAIKVLAEALANDESIKERFVREARAMAALNDPHIIQIFFIGDDAGQTYFVMEFVDGESLASLLKRDGKLKPDQAAKIIYQTAQGLVAPHEKGLIHRDIKPGNLMIERRGKIKIADFGIALSTTDLSKKLTSTGQLVGTPGYLSPEVCQGRPVDQRSDIFSLGIVLFECLTGRMPFTDLSPLGLMLEVVKADIPDVRTLNDDVDAELERILAKMVAKDPAQRYQSCQDLEADLAHHPLVAAGGPITVRIEMSPAATTLIGQPTAFASEPSTPVIPATGQPPVGAAGSTPPGTPGETRQRTAHAEPTAEQRRSAWPWAIAALVLLGVVGVAYGMRDRIPMLSQWFGARSTTTMVAASSPVTPVPPVATAAVAAAAMPDARLSAAVAADAPGASDTAVAPTPPASQPAATLASASGARPSTATAAETAPTNASPPGVANTQAQALTQLATHAAGTAHPAAPAPKQVARIKRPAAASAPPKPHIPTIAVLSAGDSAVAGPAERAIKGALIDSGYNVVDQASLAQAHRLMRGDDPRFAAVLALLAKHRRVDAVVFVHARSVGTQQLSYYGRSSTMYIVQLNVRAYAVRARHLLGRSWSEKVNFTTLNASEKVRAAVAPMLPQVTKRLADYRPRHRRG